MMRSALILVVAVAGCRRGDSSSQSVQSITPIKACPPGAELVGDSPLTGKPPADYPPTGSGAPSPKGWRQRCQKSEGVRHGAGREWYDDKRERTYSEWWDGRKHGRFTLWFKNGKVRSQGAHVFGAPAGEWKYFAEDGTIRQQQTFPLAPPPADWLDKAIAGQAPEGAPADGDPAGGRAAPGDDGGW